jgi:hypothetical protein
MRARGRTADTNVLCDYHRHHVASPRSLLGLPPEAQHGISALGICTTSKTRNHHHQRRPTSLSTCMINCVLSDPIVQYKSAKVLLANVEMDSKRTKRRISSGSSHRSFLAPLQKIILGFLVVGVLQSEAFNTQPSHQIRPNAPSTIPSRLAHVGFQPQRSPMLLTKSKGHLEEVSFVFKLFHHSLCHSKGSFAPPPILESGKPEKT